MNDSKKKIRSKDGSTSTHKTKTKKPSMEESASSLVLVSTKSTHTTTSRSRSSKTKLNALSPKKSTMTAPTFIIVNGKLVKQTATPIGITTATATTTAKIDGKKKKEIDITAQIFIWLSFCHV